MTRANVRKLATTPPPSEQGGRESTALPVVVSVVIPCYEQAQFLTEAVDSVIGQTFTDWEIVIVDDGSTDPTAAVAEALIAAHPDRRMRLVRQPNQGLSAARNGGIAASSGRFILTLDADDILLPEMLERTVGLLEREPGVAIAYTDEHHFGAVDRIVPTSDWDTDLQRRRNLFSATALYRREVWTAVGGYDTAMRRGYEDWDFWIGAAERGFVGRRIREPLYGYRVKPSSMVIGAKALNVELRRQIARNHPLVYTPGRRLRNYVRRQLELFPGRARYWLGWLLRRLTGRQPGGAA